MTTVIVCHQEGDGWAAEASRVIAEQLRAKFPDETFVAVAVPGPRDALDRALAGPPHSRPSLILCVVGRASPAATPAHTDFAPVLAPAYHSHPALLRYLTKYHRAPQIVVALEPSEWMGVTSATTSIRAAEQLNQDIIDDIVRAAKKFIAPPRPTNFVVTTTIALASAGAALFALAGAWLQLDRPANRPQIECEQRAICTPVTVFFGTNRKQVQLTDRIGFGNARADLTLGRAIVTVPRYRKIGLVQRPSYWDVLTLTNPFKEDQARHFTIPPSGVTTYSSGAMLFQGVLEHVGTLKNFRDQAFVFVHGYNTSFDAALYRAAQLTYDLGTDGPFGTAFVFSWPSGGEALDYIYDLESARFASPHLQAFLNEIFARGQFQNVHLIAHSMGNLPLLKAVEQMAALEKPLINQIILAAPDVDANEFSEIAKKVIGKAKGITLYASSNDRAIKLSRVTRKDTPRAGDVLPNGPIIIEGIDTLDSSALSTDIFAFNHSEYAERRELLNDVYRLLLSGERPPHQRNVNWKRGSKDNLAYWRYAH